MVPVVSIFHGTYEIRVAGQGGDIVADNLVPYCLFGPGSLEMLYRRDIFSHGVEESACTLAGDERDYIGQVCRLHPVVDVMHGRGLIADAIHCASQ